MAGIDEFKEVSENLPNPLIDAGVVGAAFYLWVEEVGFTTAVGEFFVAEKKCLVCMLQTSFSSVALPYGLGLFRKFTTSCKNS